MSMASSRGFTLIEMVIVILILGISAAFVVPGVVTMSQGMRLDSAANGVAGQIQLARAKAMATGLPQQICFSADSLGSDYHIHDPNGSVTASWKFPNGVTYSTSGYQSITMLTTGRASTSTFVVLQNTRGNQDTVSVQASGLVTVFK